MRLEVDVGGGLGGHVMRLAWPGNVRGDRNVWLGDNLLQTLDLAVFRFLGGQWRVQPMKRAK